MANEEGVAPSVDAFRRKLSVGAPKLGVPFGLHTALGGWLLYSLLGAGRYNSRPMDRLLAGDLYSILYWMGIATVVVTGLLGLRVVRERAVERWRWPIVLPTLVLVVLQMVVFSRGTQVVSIAGEAAGELGGSLFTLSALAMRTVAAVARIGYAFAACGLSLTGWLLAFTAGMERGGAPPRMRWAPPLLALSGTTIGALLAPTQDVLVVLLIGVSGAAALFLGRGAGTNPKALRDIFAAGICIAGACVLAGLHHFNQALSEMSVGRGDLIDGAFSLGDGIARAECALSAAWVAGAGYLLAAGVIVFTRRAELVAALRRSVALLLGVLLCFAMPWAGARVQLSRAISKLEVASEGTLPKAIRLPDAPAETLARGWLGAPWTLDSKSIATSAKATPTSDAELSKEDCAAFAKSLVTGVRLGQVTGAIDREVPYERAYCVLSAVAAEMRSKTGEDIAAQFLGRATTKRSMPRVFSRVELPPIAVSALVDARGWTSRRVTYAHVDALGRYSIDLELSGRDVDRAIARLDEGAHRYAGGKPVAITADPNASWGTVFALVVGLTRHTAILGAPSVSAEEWTPPQEAGANTAEGEGGADDDSDDGVDDDEE